MTKLCMADGTMSYFF